MISDILGHYGIHEFTAEVLASGLINSTWKIKSGSRHYILQRVNQNVFKKPIDLAENIRRLNDHLKKHSPAYLFVAPLTNDLQEDLFQVQGDGYYRLFDFIEGSHTINVVSSPEQAYEASRQFGKFTRILSDFDASSLHITIPDFHNLTLRYQQFEDSIAFGNRVRIVDAADAIGEIKKYKSILEAFEKIKKNRNVKQRVTHHDTKISNVLFDDEGKGLCVIDLDTVMPGFFISDVGDMMRTYLSPANEEENDLSKIEIRDEFFRAIVHGYLSNMRDELTGEEKDLIYYAGAFLVYMQAIRFLADHFNNDSYYGASYEGHNFSRAKNQLKLLQKLEEKKALLEEIISKELRVKKSY